MPPWQFLEKLISVISSGRWAISLCGDGTNVRDRLYVEDHVEAQLLEAPATGWVRATAWVLSAVVAGPASAPTAACCKRFAR